MLHTIPLFHANGWGPAADGDDDGSEAGNGAALRTGVCLPDDPGGGGDGGEMYGGANGYRDGDDELTRVWLNMIYRLLQTIFIGGAAASPAV